MRLKRALQIIHNELVETGGELRIRPSEHGFLAVQIVAPEDGAPVPPRVRVFGQPLQSALRKIAETRRARTSTPTAFERVCRCLTSEGAVVYVPENRQGPPRGIPSNWSVDPKPYVIYTAEKGRAAVAKLREMEADS